ncbi:SMC-Scp complex subunit ScpB [Oryzibacter oryziterrae]|uniref:SMC-Scp complex subunit ScpB n=1 Tax=Oryzibacter oryziterrae TaxID=2766474 RepID=UPI001F0260D5|nr:SMC-Scp complex subunit ScpB [Oryzibacter oryziterrae]
MSRQDDHEGHAGLHVLKGNRTPEEHERWIDALRSVEAILFAAQDPLSVEEIAERLGPGVDIKRVLRDLKTMYASRGVNLVEVAGSWMFRTAPDLAHLMRKQAVETRKLSRPALETLAIVAYHQPVTRAEIEEIRGITTAKGTLDVLLETGWIRMRGRRKVPGRPLTYGTTDTFLSHFGLEAITDLPGLDDLKGAGFIEGVVPQGFSIPVPRDGDSLLPDEEPLTEVDLINLAPLPVEE